MVDRQEVIDRLRALVNNEIEEKKIFSFEGIYQGFKAYIIRRKITSYNSVLGCSNTNYVYESKLICGERDTYRNENFTKDKIIADNQFNNVDSAVMNLADLLEEFKKGVISGIYVIGTNNEAQKKIGDSIRQCAHNLINFLDGEINTKQVAEEMVLESSNEKW